MTASASRPSTTVRPALPGVRRVLVVDDEEGIRGLLEAILADEGYETSGARDGLAALDTLRTWLPDLILLDLSMPRMDGREFLEARHQAGLAADVPVIVLSASRHIDERLQAEHTVVRKPFEVDHLLATVHRCLKDVAEPLR